jgi:hypothetical protein
LGRHLAIDASYWKNGSHRARAADPMARKPRRCRVKSAQQAELSPMWRSLTRTMARIQARSLTKEKTSDPSKPLVSKEAQADGSIIDCPKEE